MLTVRQKVSNTQLFYGLITYPPKQEEAERRRGISVFLNKEPIITRTARLSRVLAP